MNPFVFIFNLNTVTYDMSSSSFMIIRCLQEIAHQSKKDYFRANETIFHQKLHE